MLETLKRLWTRPAAGPTTLDLTDAWQQAHAHLIPFTEHLPLGPDLTRPCGLCGELGMPVAARLQGGDSPWQQVEVTYCPHCQRFSLAPEQQGPLAGLTPGTRLRIDARLWSGAPRVLNIEPTTRCNFSCWYCIGRSMPQQDLSFEDFTQVLDHFPSLEAIAIVGEGEPILNKQFFPMVQEAKRRGLYVMTLSNGSTFSTSVVEKILDSGVDYIGISIDSVRPDLFAASRLGGNLEQVWSNIDRLVRRRAERGLHLPVLGLKGTLFRHTQDELLDIVKAAKAHGLDALESFQPLNPKASYRAIYPTDKVPWLDELEPVKAAIDRAMPEALSLLPSVADRAFLISNQGRGNGRGPNCDEVWLYSLVSGDVTPCCQVKTPQYPSWNLLRNPVERILADPDYERTRFNLWNGIFPSYCQDCYKTRPQAQTPDPAQS